MRLIKKQILLILLLTANYSFGQYLYISDVRKLPTEINTLNNEESLPLVDKKNNALYFTRTINTKNIKGEFDQDIWFSNISDDSTFSEAQNFSVLNTKYNNSIFAIRQEGTKLYLLHAIDGKKGMEKGIAVSNKSGNTWSTPKKLMIPNFDEDGNFYGMYINDEETVIILSSSGVNSFGQEDLFVSTFNGTNWSSLLNLGNKINSTGFEISPFMLGDTLFFSSNGHGGYGDADIFYSIKGETWTDWSEPINLGDKINSKKFDAYFHYSDKKIFWSSNRDTFTYSNIYSASYEYIDYLDVSSSKKDVTVYKGNDGGITLKVKGGKGPFTYKWSNGSIDSNLYNIPSGNYDITVSDASGQSKTLTIFITEPVEIVADTLKKGDDLGKILNLKPIYFNLNKYELRKDAFEELDKIVKVMNEYPNMKIEIGSHTDCRGSKQYNASLSANRAKSTVKYIQKRITNPSRLTGKGYGESKLIVDCPCESNLVSKCEEEEHQKNRRSEFIIISK